MLFVNIKLFLINICISLHSCFDVYVNVMHLFYTTGKVYYNTVLLLLQ